MIPNVFQCLLDDFWNFKMFTKSGPVHPVFITKIPQEISENYGHILNKYYCFISHHFRNPKFPDCLTLPDIKHVALLLIVFVQNLVRPNAPESPKCSPGHQSVAIEHATYKVCVPRLSRSTWQLIPKQTKIMKSGSWNYEISKLYES